MARSTVSWTAALVLFAVATVAINFQVKVRMHSDGGGGAVASIGRLKVGEPAPDFALQDLAGRRVALEEFRGKKVVVLDFWATWCAPCRAAMPGLQALHDDLQDKGVALVSVNQSEEADRVRSFMERKKYTLTTVLDSDGAVGRQYGVRALPTLVVIDKQGTVRRIAVGHTNDRELRKLLQSLAQEA